MKLGIHLAFDGRCEEAFIAYRDILGGTLDTVVRWGDTAMAQQMPDRLQDKVSHATLHVAGYEIAGADVADWVPPQGVQLLLQFEEAQEAERVFNRLAEGGKATMALQKTFWSPCFGMVTDRWGVAWEINVNS